MILGEGGTNGEDALTPTFFAGGYSRHLVQKVLALKVSKDSMQFPQTTSLPVIA
jgi:hypothetical protein